MQKNFLLGISVGESFAEYSLIKSGVVQAHKRIFIARESLKISLSQFLSEHSEFKHDSAIIALRIPKKIFDLQLNSSACHIVTEGLENWLSVQNPKSALVPNKNFIFSVPERILADGSIQLPLDIKDLSNIAEKVTLLGGKKICIHFLNSTRNPSHLIQAKRFLTEKGFDVYGTEGNSSLNSNEVSRWNKDFFSAVLSSIQSERKKEINETLLTINPNIKIHYLNSNGSLIGESSSQEMDGHYSASTAIGLHLGFPTNSDVLYLGLESFQLISCDSWESSWRSPWGLVDLPHLKNYELAIQPTSGVNLNAFGRLDFTSTQEGWEPGPVCIGRGQKLTLLDLWSENKKLDSISGFHQHLNSVGAQRFSSLFFALARLSKNDHHELAHLIKSLQSLALQELAIETLLRRKEKKLLITGPFSQIFQNAFKKDSLAHFPKEILYESDSVALHGEKILEGQI